MSSDALLKKRILVIDDEPAIVMILGARLKSMGYETLGAPNGSEGLRRAEADCPDLILLDVLMPVMDGFECLARLRENAATRGIPVLMLTAMAQTADRDRAFQLGAQEYITKPFVAADLAAKVRDLLGPMPGKHR